MMKRILQRESEQLQKIAVLNPRFREVYGFAGLVTIVALALILFVLGLRWIAPWNADYSESDSKQLWTGVLFLPFGCVFASSICIEFVVKGVHLSIWVISRGVQMPTQIKIIGMIAGFLVGSGLILLFLGGDFDLWGALSIYLGLFVSYWFVVHAWRFNDEAFSTADVLSRLKDARSK